MFQKRYLRTLSHEEARRIYDRIGALQDTQAFYEDRATGILLTLGHFSSARSVFEFGCGTGRFGLRLLEEHLSGTARYRGVDISPKMVRLARLRLSSYSDRADVLLTDGGPPSAEAEASYDRFVANYVFDLLSYEEIRVVLREAHRMLRKGGLVCVAGLCTGIGIVSRFVANSASWIQRHAPLLTGGCRPVDVLPLLSESQWEVQHHSRVVTFGVPSEVVIAKRR